MWYFSNPNNISSLFLVNRGCLDMYAHLNLMYVKKVLGSLDKVVNFVIIFQI